MTRVFAPQTAYHWSWTTLSGPDAQDFLHRLTTVHVRALQPGEGAKGCFLTAQGKILAFFTLWRYGEQDFAFEFDAGQGGRWRDELLKTIDRFTFAEKLTLTDVSASGLLEPRWILAEDAASEAALLQALGAPGLRPGQTIALEEEIRLCHEGGADFGRPWLTAWGRPARLAQWLEQALPDAQPADAATLEAWRIEALRPRVDAELTEATIPLEAGLTDAIAQDKGCYPGQEVIERIISLGSPARRLARIDGEGDAPAPGEKVLNAAEPPAEVGEVTSVARREGDRFSALAYLRKIHAKEGLDVRFAKGARGSVSRVAPYA